MTIQRTSRCLMIMFCVLIIPALLQPADAWAECEYLLCSFLPGNPTGPNGFTSPATGFFGNAFTASWSHVWTGCGGYEFEYRRAGYEVWYVLDVASGSSVDVKIMRPDGSIYDPTSYELRVRAYWGGGCDERRYSEYSQSNNIEMYCGPGECSTPAQVPMPVPLGLSNPVSHCFGSAFTASWSHVWGGCGGYLFEYRRYGTEDDWVVLDVASGSSVDVKIARPMDGPVSESTSYELRVRSYWGGGCDERVLSDYSQVSMIDMRCPPPISSASSTWSSVKAFYR